MVLAAFPDHAATAQELIRAADKALYDAKTSGRDRIAVADAAPAVEVRPRVRQDREKNFAAMFSG